VVAVDAAHDTEEKDNAREGSQDLEDESRLGLVMRRRRRRWVEVGWSGAGHERLRGACSDLATGVGDRCGYHDMVFSRADGGFMD